MPRPSGVLFWLCCWLCSAGAVGWAAVATDPDDANATVITTPWEIRRQAQELMHDLSAQRAETVILLDRTQRLLHDHGEALIAFGDGWTPLSNALATHLQQVGLQEEFRRRFEPVAARELDRLIDGAADWRQLLRLAREFPGTEAAQRAWRLVIDHAWDRGHLGTYLTFAEAAGEASNPQRRQRIAIARRLLQPQRDRALPETLTGLGEMWAITGLPAITRDETSIDRHPFQEVHQEEQERPLARYRFSTDVSQGLVAACDGQRLVLFDPLIGHRVGEVIDIGGGASQRIIQPI